MAGVDLIQDLGLVMLIAALAGWLCQRIGLPVVIAYLGAGMSVSAAIRMSTVCSSARTNRRGKPKNGSRLPKYAERGKMKQRISLK